MRRLSTTESTKFTGIVLETKTKLRAHPQRRDRKTNALISKLVPVHILSVIKNEKRKVDGLHDLTLLFTDMVGFTAFSKNALNPPKEVFNL